ncbi:carbohydrate-binding protein [Diaminobutyricibacter sp. McL0618]|uniref:carbohydrate-binding protein n=1 Tax=Leifsonia sp. McL0618 TaxID=3415677 RepID=UPI003CEFE10B
MTNLHVPRDGTTEFSINPFLPPDEYIPDGEPHVFGDRVYVYGSHDLSGMKGGMCAGDYVCYSASLENLADWRYDGVIYKRRQDPYADRMTEAGDRMGLKSYLFAPDVIEIDGTYYLYYGVALGKSGLALAVSDSPTGPFEYVGRVRYPEDAKPAGWTDDVDGIEDGDMAFAAGRPLMDARGMHMKGYPYDPALLVHDGRLFLYYGCAYCYVVELDMSDKRTVVKNPDTGTYETEIFAGNGWGMLAGLAFGRGPELQFGNGPSIREIDGRFVLAYYASGRGRFNGMYHAVASDPRGPFTLAGPLVSLGNVRYDNQVGATDRVGNIHGGMFEVDGTWYQIYHRHTKDGRQACATPLTRKADGTFEHAEYTSQGFSTDPLPAFRRWPAYMACYLTDGRGRGSTRKRGPNVAERAFLGGPDRRDAANEGIVSVVTGLAEGSVVGFKYFDFADGQDSPTTVTVELNSETAGTVDVRVDDPTKGPLIGSIRVTPTGGRWAPFESDMRPTSGAHAIYLVFHPDGPSLGSIASIEFSPTAH